MPPYFGILKDSDSHQTSDIAVKLFKEMCMQTMQKEIWYVCLMG